MTELSPKEIFGPQGEIVIPAHRGLEEYKKWLLPAEFPIAFGQSQNGVDTVLTNYCRIGFFLRDGKDPFSPNKNDWFVKATKLTASECRLGRILCRELSPYGGGFLYQESFAQFIHENRDEEHAREKKKHDEGKVDLLKNPKNEIKKMSENFQTSLHLMTQEVERIWKGKEAELASLTKESLEGGKTMFPSEHDYARNEGVSWLRTHLSKSTIEYIDKWLMPGEFPIIVGRKGDHGSIRFTLYTNFARKIVGDGQGECEGIWYEGTDNSHLMGKRVLYPSRLGKRGIDIKEDKAHPLTNQQCQALIALAGAKRIDYSRLDPNTDPIYRNWVEGGEPLVEELMGIFKQNSDQPLLHQVIEQSKVNEAIMVMLENQRKELTAKEDEVGRIQREIDKDRIEIKRRIERLAVKKSQFATVADKLRQAASLISGATKADSKDVAQFDVEEALELISEVCPDDKDLSAGAKPSSDA